MILNTRDLKKRPSFVFGILNGYSYVYSDDSEILSSLFPDFPKLIQLDPCP